MNSEEIRHYLDNTPVRYDNEAYKNFLAKVGVPPLPTAIHITGTNGKGSSARYLSLALEKSGYRVGLFTSPHYLKINELATINGEQIPDSFIAGQIHKYDKEFKIFKLSSFEIMTFISFTYFVAMHVDFTIVEVGMGGLLDATNIFIPALSVITNIALDHVKELGPTISDIAKHKSGIIKEGVPVIVGECPTEAKMIIEKAATDKNAKLITFNPKFSIIEKTITSIKFIYESNNYYLGSGATYEVSNAILVLNIISFLRQKGIVINDNAIEGAFLEETYPGRYSVASLNPPIIVDGAHNPHAMQTILNDIKGLGYKLSVVFAAFKDKDYEQELDLLSLCGAKITLTTFSHPRAKNEYNNNLPFFDNHQDAIKHAIKNIGEKELLLIVGSLYFANLVTREFQGDVYATQQ